MTKLKFLLALHDRLSHLPQDEVEERLNFYTEMIEDRMEEGLSEEDAVSAVGSVEEIAAQIEAELSGTAVVAAKSKLQRPLKTWEIVLLVLGSPIWFSLLVAAAAVAVSLYAVAWAVIVSLWAAFVSLAACAVVIAVMGIIYLCCGNMAGIALLGSGIVCLGLSVFLFLGCKALTNSCVLLTRKLAAWLRRWLTRKEAAQ